MALVLCNGIGACCNGLCTVLAIPFRMCGGCCQALGEACGGCTKLCGLVFCQSPFTPYVVTTLALQIGPVLWSILTILDPAPNDNDTDCAFLNVWMYVFGALSLAHIVGAFYIALRMAQNLDELPSENNNNRSSNTTYGTAQQQSTQQANASNSGGGKYIWEYVQDLFTTESNNNNNNQPPTTPSNNSNANRGGSNSWKRLGHLMCYDIGVALYIVVCLVWVVWLFLGISVRTSADDDNEDCERVADMVQSCLICGFIYIVLVALSFCCSMVFLKL